MKNLAKQILALALGTIVVGLHSDPATIGAVAACTTFFYLVFKDTRE